MIMHILSHNGALWSVLFYLAQKQIGKTVRWHLCAVIVNRTSLFLLWVIYYCGCHYQTINVICFVKTYARVYHQVCLVAGIYFFQTDYKMISVLSAIEVQSEFRVKVQNDDFVSWPRKLLILLIEIHVSGWLNPIIIRVIASFGNEVGTMSFHIFLHPIFLFWRWPCSLRPHRCIFIILSWILASLR